MQKLLALEDQKAPVPRGLLGQLAEIQTPLRAQAWREGLQNHPDKQFAEFVVRGIEQGFCIGFNRKESLKPNATNLFSARQAPHVIHDYLTEELRLGRIAQVPASLESDIHVSPIGAVRPTLG